MESRKMVLMNLSAGHQWRHRHREQAYGHRAGGGEGGADGESSMDTDTLARVRYTARGLCCRLAIKPALGQPRGRHWVRGGRQVETGRRYVYLRLIQVDVWQKPTLYCKAIILQLKINKSLIMYLKIYTNKHFPVEVLTSHHLNMKRRIASEGAPTPMLHMLLL